NDTKKEIVRDKCYERLFEEQTGRTPDRVAVVHNGRWKTYGELNKSANQIARFLREQGAGPGTLVALYMKRSTAMLASILGVFKAGAAYLPLEIDFPGERIRYILESSETKIVLADNEARDKIETTSNILPFEMPLLYFDHHRSTAEMLQPYSEENPVHSHSTNTGNLAYIIYTSGTTGNPKGVMITHIGMINHLYAKINELSISGDDIVAQTASASFDISVWQFLAAPLRGGTTCVVDRETVLEPQRFLKVLRKGRITILESVPSLMTAFLEVVENEPENELRHLKWMIPTGEALGAALVRKWYAGYPGIKLVNAYGPTEASDDVTHYVVEEVPPAHRQSIPIGKPLQNLHIYILDKNLKLCPVGVRGEICVAGIGVGKGYLKDEEKTAKVFVNNPFMAEIRNEDYARVYKTRDIGYYREDGNIECLGRLDHQVKIRGNRIELGEIEKNLKGHEKIMEAAVQALDGASGAAAEKYLCADIVTRGELAATHLREYLAERLPDYMIPAHYVYLDKLPLSTSGKIDKKVLPQPKTVNAGDGYAAPATNMEKSIAEIWKEVLNLEKVGVNDVIFEIGGTSLDIIRIHAKFKELTKRDIPVMEMFKYTTISTFARVLEREEPGDEFAVKDRSRKLEKGRKDRELRLRRRKKV
ncbi:MAG: non-ribosomal peptide synthetase, partial [bacterium]|nr:non-ribosomal peptide synthetase [bacterium]